MLLNLTGADVLVILEFRHSMPVTVFFCVAYTLVFVVGVIGNCFVVVVVYRSPRMRSPTNLFIVNLAFADLLVNVLCLPFTLVGNLMSAWIMGWVICKTVPYLQGVSVSASINTLVAISVERCLAICYPMRWQMTSRACRVVVIVIWLFSLTITLPWAVVFGLQPLEEGSDMQICIEHWPSGFIGNVYFVVAHLVMCYLFPLVLISVCYLLIWRRVCQRTLPGEPQLPGGGVDLMIHRSKVKVIKMLLVVVVSFALSWLPLYVLFTRVKFGGPPSTEMEEALIHALLPLAQWLGASNSCVNPILYTFFNRKFRAGFHAIITSRSCCGTLRYDDSFAANSSTRSSFKYKLNKPATGSANKLVTRMTISSSSGDRCKTHLLPATNNNNNNSTLLKRHNSASTVSVFRTKSVTFNNLNNNKLTRNLSTNSFVGITSKDNNLYIGKSPTNLSINSFAGKENAQFVATSPTYMSLNSFLDNSKEENRIVTSVSTTKEANVTSI